jgi:hypothetical protein
MNTAPEATLLVMGKGGGHSTWGSGCIRNAAGPMPSEKSIKLFLGDSIPPGYHRVVRLDIISGIYASCSTPAHLIGLKLYLLSGSLEQSIMFHHVNTNITIGTINIIIPHQPADLPGSSAWLSPLSARCNTDRQTPPQAAISLLIFMLDAKLNLPTA